MTTSLKEAISYPEDPKEKQIAADARISALPLIGAVCCILINILYYDSPWILVLTIPQILFVFFQLITKGLDHAVLWHFIFIITGIEATTANVTDFSDIVLLSYLRLKVLGPIGLSYLLSIFLMFYSLRKKILIKGMFYQLFLFLSLLFILGGTLSCIGMLAGHHTYEEFVKYNVHLGMICCNMLLLLHVMTPYMQKTILPTLLTLLTAAPIATFLSWNVLHKTTVYSVFDAALQSQIDFFSPCLLLFFLHPVKGKFYICLGLLCLACNLFFSGGGEELTILIAVFIILMFICFTQRKYFVLKIVTGILLAVSCSIIASVMASQDTSSIFALKVQEIFAPLRLFSQNTPAAEVWEYIPHSPYVRIAEIQNLLHEYLRQPFLLLFGQGPGGYIEDSLCLFSYTQLGSSDFSLDAISSGKFASLHFSVARILLINGLLGLIGICSFLIRYMAKSKKCPLVVAAFVWFFVSFYFNMQTAIVGILMLFAYDLLFPPQEKAPLQ